MLYNSLFNLIFNYMLFAKLDGLETAKTDASTGLVPYFTLLEIHLKSA